MVSGEVDKALKKEYDAVELPEPGARSRAAWRASLFGAAVKVSEDGPVTIYVREKKVAEVG
jgi:hypothetical protein